MAVLKSRLLSVILGLLVAMTVAWVLKIPDRLGFALITQQVIAIVLGLTVAASFLSPRNSSPLSGWADLLLAAFGMASWFWLAWNFNDWMLTLAYRTPDMWIPGAIAIVITVEALRRAALAAAAERRHVAMGGPARHLSRLGRRDLDSRFGRLAFIRLVVI